MYSEHKWYASALHTNDSKDDDGDEDEISKQWENT